MKKLINFIVKIELFFINFIKNSFNKIKDFLYIVVTAPIGIVIFLMAIYADNQVGKENKNKKIRKKKEG